MVLVLKLIIRKHLNCGFPVQNKAMLLLSLTLGKAIEMVMALHKILSKQKNGLNWRRIKGTEKQKMTMLNSFSIILIRPVMI